MADRSYSRDLIWGVLVALVVFALAVVVLVQLGNQQSNITNIARENRAAECGEINLWKRALSYPPGTPQTARQKATVADFTHFLTTEAAPLHCP